jgi:pimeloyl-ACP methyl ester carboxylesterase
VGHSYGDAVALRVAVERPARIASLSLYEPTAFHVLKATGKDGQVALEDIRTLAANIGRLAVSGANWATARCFVDYWNRAGTFEPLKPDVQADLVRYGPERGLQERLHERTRGSCSGRLGGALAIGWL